MTDRERINFFPTEEDAKLIDEQIGFYGGDGPSALRRGLRAAQREIEVAREAHAAAKSTARAHGKARAPRRKS